MAVDKEFVRRVLTEQRVKKVETNKELVLVMQNGMKMLLNDLNYINNTIFIPKGIPMVGVMQYGFDIKECKNLLTKEEMYKIVDVFMEFPYLLAYFVKTHKIDRTKINPQSELYNLVNQGKITDKEISFVLASKIIDNTINQEQNAYLFGMLYPLKLYMIDKAKPRKKETYYTVITEILEIICGYSEYFADIDNMTLLKADIAKQFIS